MEVKIMLPRMGTAHSRLASIANTCTLGWHARTGGAGATLPISVGRMQRVIWPRMGPMNSPLNSPPATLA